LYHRGKVLFFDAAYANQLTTMRIFRSLAVSIPILLLTVSTYAGTNDWFYRITPPNGAAAFDVGPYNSEYGCKDWLGSALFLHGPHCHDDPNARNCAPIGNGFAYPAGFPYPMPRDQQIPSGSCFESSARGFPQGYYFFWYSNRSPFAAAIGPFGPQKCDSVLAGWTQGRPGSGCFFIGNTRE
jgi:hypothetical protein